MSNQPQKQSCEAELRESKVIGVLLSIQPIFSQKIIERKKTVEFRRRFTMKESAGYPILIYETSPTKAIVSRAKIDVVKTLPIRTLWKEYSSNGGITYTKFLEYFSGCALGIAICLSDVVPLQNPIKLPELREIYGLQPPQSFMYITGAHRELVGDERV